MFFGIINNSILINFIKIYFFKKFNFCYIFLKIFFFNNLLNIGDSFSIQGVCLTLINKNNFFFEFDLNNETILNLNNLFFYKIINFEKSFNIYNNNDGNFIFGHINNNLILFKKYIYFNKFYKFYFLLNIYYLNYIFYKTSICFNGISLTLNNLYYLYLKKIFCLNILKYTYFITNFKYLKIFLILNIEFDLIIYYLINFIYV